MSDSATGGPAAEAPKMVDLIGPTKVAASKDATAQPREFEQHRNQGHVILLLFISSVLLRHPNPLPFLLTTVCVEVAPPEIAEDATNQPAVVPLVEPRVGDAAEIGEQKSCIV